MTDWEKEYTFEIIPSRGSDFYYDNPSSAQEDVEFLIEIIKKLKDSEDLNEDLNNFKRLL